MHQLQSLDDLLALYVRERNPSEVTVINFGIVLSRFQRETACSQLSEVSRSTVVEWKNMLNQRVAETSVNTYLRTMRTLFNLAGQLGLHRPNPFQGVSYIPEYNKLKHTAEHVEIINLLGMIQQFPKDNRPEWFWSSVVKVLYYTGMRRRQLVELCWGDIDFRAKRILLRAESSKTRREWHIPMVDEVAQALQLVKGKTLSRLDVQQANSIRNQQVFNITLFNHHYEGKRMNSDQVTGYFKRASKRYHITVSPHRFRHTFATQVANQGEKNLKHLQRMLGHTNIKTTLGYVQSDTESMRTMVGGIRAL
jgi:site-specific recombinase XerD